MDILNLNEALFDEINRRVREFVPAARNPLTEKTDSAAALVQERLNAVWKLIFSLPAYRNLQMDEPYNYHTFQWLMADKEKWAQVQDPVSEGYAKYQGMLIGLCLFTEQLRDFRQLIDVIVDKYLEPLKHRNSSAYAEAYSCLYPQSSLPTPRFLSDNSKQGIPVEVSFVLMMHPHRKGGDLHREESKFQRPDRLFADGVLPWTCYGERPAAATTADGTSC